MPSSLYSLAASLAVAAASSSAGFGGVAAIAPCNVGGCATALAFTSTATTTRSTTCSCSSSIGPSWRRRKRLRPWSPRCTCWAHSDAQHSDNASGEHFQPAQDDSAPSAPSRREFLQQQTLAMASALLTTSVGQVALMQPPRAHAADPSATTAEDILLALPSPPPFSSRREYKHIILPNGLRVLLVHDGGIDRCCAALSIGNAGQFLDPVDLPGAAHLCEHMVLSSRSRGSSSSPSSSSSSPPSSPSRSSFPRRRFDDVDFEDWLGEYDGSSNGFTAAGKVCFHFTLPQPEAFPEALVRFAGLFDQDTFEATCRDETVLRREVRRVDSELDISNDSTRAFYLLKMLANPDHPFSRLGAGNLNSLETVPKSEGVDVSKRLMEFFDERYIAPEAVLVVTSPDNVRTLERLVAPFSNKFSKQKFVLEEKLRDVPSSVTNEPSNMEKRATSISFPPPFRRLDYRQNILVKRDDDGSDTLSLAWPLELQYSDINADDIGASSTKPLIVAPLVGFVVSQILGRQGPESLNAFLLRRGWVQPGLKGKPRITFPVDVSGFQVMRLELGLTAEGFANRSALVAAILECIEATAKLASPSSDQPFLLPRELIAQYISTARLHGYILAPRPPDAVELAVDSQTFGLDGQGVGVLGTWPLFPNPNDGAAVEELRKAVAATLSTMVDPGSTIATIIARESSIKSFVGGLVDPSLPALDSPLWEREPLTKAQYYVENVAGLDRLLVSPMLWALGKVEGDELGPPVLNPLLPARLRPPRTKDESQSVTSVIGDRWTLYRAAPRERNGRDISLPLPLISPEPSSRCSLVVQLLSNRPRQATVRQAARSQLWLASFDDDIVDLAEFGAPAGLAYDLSFNAYGLRICFRGISQSLPSYARRFCRRLVQHHARLVDGSAAIAPTTKLLAMNQASRLQEPPLRKRQIIGNLRTGTALDAAAEGLAFLNSCDGGLAFAQGDLLNDEAVELCKEIKSIFSRVATENYGSPVQPNSLGEILYNPLWKPKTSSPFLIPGVALISDACGRVQR